MKVHYGQYQLKSKTEYAAELKYQLENMVERYQRPPLVRFALNESLCRCETGSHTTAAGQAESVDKAGTGIVELR